ncbi:hypothetical protein F5884DRAFT_709319 [Xylogone sp. PMI_703]|nr:hypothetical protein F5884DRAFT_709319 [Xylogone sp. PMI_703]
MASRAASNEQTPLLNPPAPQTQTDALKNARRSVTFNPNPAVITIDGSTKTLSKPIATTTRPSSAENTVGTGITALNRVRRRNSYGAPGSMLNHHLAKIGPQRTTKNAEKLKILPNPEIEEEGPDEESGRDVYSQYTRIKDPTARRDAARLGKADRDRLPRVTAYCTSNKYNLDGLMRFLKGKGKSKGASPKLFDECIYTPYSYVRHFDKMNSRILEVQSAPVPPALRDRRHSDSEVEIEDSSNHIREDLIDLHTDAGDTSLSSGENHVGNRDIPEVEQRAMEEEHARSGETGADFDVQVHTPEVFLYDYGVVVIWGMSLQHEQRFLKEIAKFESEKLAQDDIQTENFNFYYTREYQARIYNDFITLREKNNYMTKLAISHALAQSVKTSLFEELVDNTIEACKDIPTQIALTGKINLSRTEINMQIGELFILRINIHLNGSVLDTPELFWVEPQLEPVYQAVRSYLEMDQRVSLLTERLDVIADLLAVLKDQLSHGHGEMLEWIVIVLIAAEILVAIINIVVDLYAGVE